MLANYKGFTMEKHLKVTKVKKVNVNVSGQSNTTVFSQNPRCKDRGFGKILNEEMKRLKSK